MNLTKPRRVIDRKYRRLVMANETCVVAQSMLRLAEVARLTGGPSFGSVWRCESIGNRQYEFHHVKKDGGGKTGSKDDDRRGVKCCAKHHEMAARREKFESDFAIDLEAVILELNAKYPKEKVKREPQKRQAIAKVKQFVIACECPEIHKVPLSKTGTITDETVSYWCRNLKRWMKAKYREANVVF